MSKLLKIKESVTYAPSYISDADSDAEDPEKRDLLRLQQQDPAQTSSWRRCFTWSVASAVLNIILVALIVGFIIGAHQREQNLNNNVNNILMKKSSIYSPIFDSLPLKYEDTFFNGALFDMNNTIWRRAPSPEVDDAWNRISNVGPFVVNADTIRKIGKDPKTAVKLPRSWGLGNDAYYAQVDSFHQIHCLNVLRRSVYTNRPYYEKLEAEHKGIPSHSVKRDDDHALQEAHISHCIYSVLQTLRCQANTDIITHNWVKGQEHPYPDFKVQHRCRNFDTLLDWYEGNRLDIKGKEMFTRPPAGEFVESPSPDGN